MWNYLIQGYINWDANYKRLLFFVEILDKFALKINFMKEVKWQGVYPAVTTKFDENGNLDLPNFLRNIEFQIFKGISGIIIGGSLGESSVLTHAERLELVKSALERFGDQIDIILNIAEGSNRNAISLMKEAETLGVHGFMLLPPMLYLPTEKEVADYFKDLASNTSLPIMLYNLSLIHI